MILQDRTILIMGYASKRSIAYGIAKSANQQGAKLIICCANEKLSEKAQFDFESFNHVDIHTLNVENEEHIHQILENIHQKHPIIDGIVHAIAYAECCQIGTQTHAQRRQHINPFIYWLTKSNAWL